MYDFIGSRKRKYLLNNSPEKQQKLGVNHNNIVDSVSDDESLLESSDSDQQNDSNSKKDDLSTIPEPHSEEKVEEEHANNKNKEENIAIKKEFKKSVEKKPVKQIERRPAVFVEVDRSPEIQAVRLKLPILGEEQTVMEYINENNIVILTGETGSGKTTQVPQFLYEAGYAKDKIIGITEPRRVAAISMSERVATEMNLSNKIVSYLIRFEGNTSPETKIKFMTDGVLLKEIQTDFSLNKYSVIILDEAHERSVHTDILIGLLSRIVPYRNKHGNPLKLIIMSATLRIEDFRENTRLFKTPPPVVNIEARQYPVFLHFNKRTPDNYLLETFRKTVKIHTTLPEGGILIFLTGQLEINSLVRKLRKVFPYKNIKNSTSNNNEENVELDSDGDEIEWSMKRAIRNAKKRHKNSKTIVPNVNLDDYDVLSDDADADLNEIDDRIDDESDDEEYMNLVNLSNTQPLWVLPMYSLLPSHKQAKVFKPPPEGTRLCVVSTNVAETSLTIPNIKYVIDTGKQKTRYYDKITGVSAFVITNCSKAAANQRAGRAGRTGPGHCYRLYSSAVFNDEFQNFAIPDIQRKPVDDLMLQMKSMGIEKVVNFPFPSAPDLLQLRYAETRLILLGALESKQKSIEENDYTAKITDLGKAISAFPVAPRFGKMLALSHQHDLLPYTVCMVAGLSVQEVLLEVALDNEGRKSKWATTRRSWAGTGNSLYMGDPMILLQAIGAAEYAGSINKLDEFCTQNGLRPKALTEIRKLRIQLTNDINLNMPNLNLYVDPKMHPPSDFQAKLLRQILLSGLGDHVARKINENELKVNEDKRKFKYAYNCCEMEEPVFIHSCSVLKKKAPEWVVYQDIYESKIGDESKIFIRGITAIEPEWLAKYVPMLCNFSEPLSDPEPRYCSTKGRIYCHVDATFGKSGWSLPVCEIEYPNNFESYKWFAYFLLEGVVFEKLCKYKNSLLSNPNTMIKNWARLLPRTTALLNSLTSNLVNTRDKLIESWKSDPKCKYLL